MTNLTRRDFLIVTSFGAVSILGAAGCSQNGTAAKKCFVPESVTITESDWVTMFTFESDSAGNITKIATAEGRNESNLHDTGYRTYSNDDDGNILSVTSEIPGNDGSPISSETLNYSYQLNDDGSISEQTDSYGNKKAYSYADGIVTMVTRDYSQGGHAYQDISSFSELGYLTKRTTKYLDESRANSVNDYLYTFDDEGNLTEYAINTGTTINGSQDVYSVSVTRNEDGLICDMNMETAVLGGEQQTNPSLISVHIDWCEVDNPARAVQDAQLFNDYFALTVRWNHTYPLVCTLT